MVTMSGYRPQNRGNKTTARTGPVVTRRLKAAGINVSPAANKYNREGVYVSARGQHVSVFIDLPGEDNVTAVADEVVKAVTSWGIPADRRLTRHDIDGGHTATVTFTYKENP